MAVSGWTCPWGAREGQIDAVDPQRPRPNRQLPPARESASGSPTSSATRASPTRRARGAAAILRAARVGGHQVADRLAVGARAQGAAPQGARSVRRLPDAGHDYDHDVGFPTTATIYLFSYRKSALTNPNTYACRSGICGDNGNDCCAPGGEARDCTLPGYKVTAGDMSGTKGWCADMFDDSAVYQCCPPSVAIGPAPEGGFSWNGGAWYCAATGKSLCTKKQLCRNGRPIDQVGGTPPMGQDMWVPIAGGETSGSSTASTTTASARRTRRSTQISTVPQHPGP